MRGICVLGALAVLVASAAWAATEIPIRATQLRERSPVAGSGYLAWAQDSRRRPKRYVVYAQKAGGRPTRISRAKTFGFPGGISGTTLVYQEFAGRRSDVRFYDFARKRHVAVRQGINTKQWEWRPSLSGDNLLFARHNGRIERVLLHNIRTGASTELDSSRLVRGEHTIRAGQVNGTFAVWQKCMGRTCVVYRYDTTTKLTTPLPPPPGRVHYSPSVTPEGTVYLGRSEPRCGAAAEIWRYPLVGVPTKLVSLQAGWDFANSYALSMTKPPIDVTRTEVYYDRGRCRGGRFDLYKFVDVVRQPPPPSG
jgi:hypothetical protein